MSESPIFAEGKVLGTGDVRAVTYGEDTGLHVEFWIDQEYQSFRSEQEGKPIYEPITMVTMYVPGDKTKMPTRKAQLEWIGEIPPDSIRFPKQWASFQSGQTAIQSGIPLDEGLNLVASQIRELNAANIYTVEALAGVADASLDSLGHGGRALRDKAKARLQHMSDNAGLERLVSQNADLQRQLDELRNSVMETPKRGPGRPRVNTDEAEAA